MQEELSAFKATVRDIARHEMQIKDGKVSTAESRQDLTRLANLGRIGNQAAVSGHSKVIEEERTAITEAILGKKQERPRKAYRESKYRVISFASIH